MSQPDLSQASNSGDEKSAVEGAVHRILDEIYLDRRYRGRLAGAIHKRSKHHRLDANLLSDIFANALSIAVRKATTFLGLVLPATNDDIAHKNRERVFAWLVTIACTEYRHALEKRSAYPADATGGNHDNPVNFHYRREPSPLENLIHREVGEAVDAAVATLSHRERAVFTYVFRLGHDAAAKKLGLTYTNVCAILCRVRKKLREGLLNEHLDILRSASARHVLSFVRSIGEPIPDHSVRLPPVRIWGELTEPDS